MLTFTPTTDFEPCPVGQYEACVVGVYDLFDQPTNFGLKPQYRLVFELNHARDDGKPWIIGETLTASIHPKAKLHKYLMQMGHPPFKDGDTFNPHSLLGRFVAMTVVHANVPQADGSIKKYANIGAMLPTKNRFEVQNPQLTEEDSLLLSDYWQEKIQFGKNNRVAQSAHVKQEAAPVEELDDEIPWD